MDRVYATSAQGLPLDATVNDKKFKMNFIDIGLVKRINQLDASLLLNEVSVWHSSFAVAAEPGERSIVGSPVYGQ